MLHSDSFDSKLGIHFAIVLGMNNNTTQDNTIDFNPDMYQVVKIEITEIVSSRAENFQGKQEENSAVILAMLA